LRLFHSRLNIHSHQPTNVVYFIRVMLMVV
jgi:hypothetical protein